MQKMDSQEARMECWPAISFLGLYILVVNVGGRDIMVTLIRVVTMVGME